MSEREMRKAYFLISVSNKKNLELCLKYALAGFMNNISGVWTFEEIQEGDFVSFLYEAKAHNLYVDRLPFHALKLINNGQNP